VEEKPVKEVAAEPAVKPADKQAEKPVDKPAEVKTAAAAADTQEIAELKEEAYDEIFSDVKAFIEYLNTIIQSKNYNKWRATLSEERFKELSSSEFLASASRTNSMRRRGIVLKTLYDYFLYVVVPSRANSKIDKIEIVDNNRVRAIYMHTRITENGNEEITETEPLLVYELAKTKDSWNIIR